jgi:hypothetical protein
MLRLYQDPWFTFRFAEDRSIPVSTWKAWRLGGLSRFSGSTLAPASAWDRWRRQRWATAVWWTCESRSLSGPVMRLSLCRNRLGSNHRRFIPVQGATEIRGR